MTYDRSFFDYVNSGSLQSARAVLPLLQAAHPVSSVLDVGCGTGAWLAAWRELGVDDIAGVDGAYVERSQLLIPTDSFVAADLAHTLDLHRRFDLVQSLEVAEHLPAAAADRFVESLVRHSCVILFSAACPGQGGDHHINEQTYEYWRTRFAEHGYQPVDYLRPLIASVNSIEPWYRYNLILYVHAPSIGRLAAALRAAMVPAGTPIADLSPALYRARKAVIRRLPVPVNTALAKLKERAVSRWRRSRAPE